MPLNPHILNPTLVNVTIIDVHCTQYAYNNVLNTIG